MRVRMPLRAEDLFDWSESAKELPDMPKDSGKAQGSSV